MLELESSPIFLPSLDFPLFDLLGRFFLPSFFPRLFSNKVKISGPLQGLISVKYLDWWYTITDEDMIAVASASPS